MWELYKVHLDGHGWSVLLLGLIVASISAFFAIWGLMQDSSRGHSGRVLDKSSSLSVSWRVIGRLMVFPSGAGPAISSRNDATLSSALIHVGSRAREPLSLQAASAWQGSLSNFDHFNVYFERETRAALGNKTKTVTRARCPRCCSQF